MKSTHKIVEDRQMGILKLVTDNGSATVEGIARQYGISLMTVRRDLQYLEERNLLRRTHGGAVSQKLVMENGLPAYVLTEEAVRGRDVVSRFAAGLVQDGDTIFINGSRTALDLLKYVGDKNVTVFTNNGWAVGEVYPRGVRVCMSGGELRGRIMMGEQVVKNLLDMRADKTFLGCAAVYDDGEFQYNIPTEIGIHEAMISRTAGELFILADHTKFHRRGAMDNIYGSCTYDHSYSLITDAAEDDDVVGRLQALGMNVIFATGHAEES